MLNKVMLIGNLGEDPVLRFTKDGTAVSSLSVATNESYKDKSGERKERTEWHRVVIWGKLAEVCCENLKKGSKAYFEGRLNTRSREDKDGSKRYSTDVVAETVRFLNSKQNASQDNSKHANAKKENYDYGPPPLNDDEVPF